MGPPWARRILGYLENQRVKSLGQQPRYKGSESRARSCNRQRGNKGCGREKSRERQQTQGTSNYRIEREDKGSETDGDR